MIVFDVLVKRKVALDQLRNGLSTLGVLEAIQKYPNVMVKYFVEDMGSLTAEKMLGRIEFVNGNENNKKTFENVLKSFNLQFLKKFLVFVTGGESLSSIPGTQNIQVKLVNASSIFSSTCTFELMVPFSIFLDEDLLKTSLEAVFTPYQSSFNTM